MSPDLSAVENEFILYLQILCAVDDFPILYSSYSLCVLLPNVGCSFGIRCLCLNYFSANVTDNALGICFSKMVYCNPLGKSSQIILDVFYYLLPSWTFHIYFKCKYSPAETDNHKLKFGINPASLTSTMIQQECQSMFPFIVEGISNNYNYNHNAANEHHDIFATLVSEFFTREKPVYCTPVYSIAMSLSINLRFLLIC